MLAWICKIYWGSAVQWDQIGPVGPKCALTFTNVTKWLNTKAPSALKSVTS